MYHLQNSYALSLCVTQCMYVFINLCLFVYFLLPQPLSSMLLEWSKVKYVQCIKRNMASTFWNQRVVTAK